MPLISYRTLHKCHNVKDVPTIQLWCTVCNLPNGMSLRLLESSLVGVALLLPSKSMSQLCAFRHGPIVFKMPIALSLSL